MGVTIRIDEWRMVMRSLGNMDDDEADLEVFLPELLEKSLKVDNNNKKRNNSPVKKEVVDESYDSEFEETSSESEEDEEHQILLFQVVLKKDTETHEVLLYLEYLRDIGPDKLLEFLQSKLNFTTEEDLDTEDE